MVLGLWGGSWVLLGLGIRTLGWEHMLSPFRPAEGPCRCKATSWVGDSSTKHLWSMSRISKDWERV